MRIIGGEFRGRRLSSVGKGDAGAHLRPTTDRVRESLFNILGSYGMPDGARVLDLFAGTGALGLEALSRGAVHASFIETGRAALKLLKNNIDLCGVAGCTDVSTRDARRLGTNASVPYDLVFLDPPYGKSLGEASLTAALEGGWIAPNALIVWEENTSVDAPAALTLQDERRYGDTMIRLFTSD
ncbi:MAG: 16S rRNA (guanine(966)-N(2))-methyltransferase RsmD [Roseovarius sp.]